MSWRRRHWVVVGVAFAVIAGIGVIVPRWADARLDPTAAPRVTLNLDIPPLPSAHDGAAASAPVPTIADWRTVSVKPGQTVDSIFRDAGVSGAQLHELMQDPNNAQALRYIRPGDEFAFSRDADGVLQALRFDRDDKNQVEVKFDDDGLHQNVRTHALEYRRHIAHGVLQGSLFDAAERAGMSDAMVMKLADVFKFDIDFIKDIRAGDTFTVIYDDVYRDGAYLHCGEIIAAEFVNHGHRFTAYRYTLADGSASYYSEDGRPLQKSLLRTPVKFSRISSRFSLARHHPILGYTRAHKGVDYAAPKGTPIHAAGDGVIRFRGWEHGYGRFVLIRHTGEYSTAYGHMSAFAKGLHIGSRVRQGDVIGYVGMTGLATGPHLHYEVRVFGKQRNPLTMTMPKPQPLPATQLVAFEQHIQPLQTRIHTLDSNVALVRAATHRSNSDG
ncbi:MAG TPA: peptidoglycan DD-metalloendopeptidase family protein [Rudaea sp.]|nr:peptidoglycan DD-metalloendopeptidase family protein [Rudaea sp.]